MRRHPDWPQRLGAAIADKRHLPHAWGENDCALCAADLVRAQTGEDFGVAFRGRYSDRAGAQAILDALGLETLVHLVDAFLPRLPHGERPRRGDVVLQPHPDGAFLAVIWGGGIVAPGARGLVLMPRAPDAPCWRVG